MTFTDVVYFIKGSLLPTLAVNLTGPLKLLAGVGIVDASAVPPSRLESFTKEVSMDPS